MTILSLRDVTHDVNGQNSKCRNDTVGSVDLSSYFSGDFRRKAEKS